MTFDQELRDKVARMRALGVVELETANGFVRRLALGPVPDGTPVDWSGTSNEPAPVEPAPPPVVPEAQAKADEAAKKAKADRLKFGAGK